jgi:ABC-type polysaccharide/polyol phosphate transport system ATPase subunit
MTTAISLDRIGKQYRIGARRSRPSTLREALARAAAAPLRNWRELRHHGAGQDDADLIWALHDVSFEVKEGEVLGVVGRNGAGKSTLLKILSRITSPTAGRALVHGRMGSLLEIGTGFHPELTGRDNIYLNGCILGMERSYVTRRFDEIVEFAEVARFLDTAVKHYSSGMYLRLAFAVAAHLRSEILIVDEVLAVGDAEFQAKCLAKMQEVANEGRTILFVSHNLNAIQRMCPRSILLEGGRLAGDGATADVLRQYLALSPESSEPARWLDTSRLQRTGTRETCIEAVEYRSGNAAIGEHAYPDGPLEVRLRLVSDSARTVGGFGLSLHDEDGTALVTVDTISTGLVTTLERGPNVVGLRIQSLHLNPGVYHVALWARGPLGRLVFDRIESAFTLRVVDPHPAISRPRAGGPTTCEFQVLPLV